MPVPLLDLEAQYAALRDPLEEAIAELLASQSFILGPAVQRFERGVAAFVGVPHAIGCASGTDALLLTLRALQLDPGDEVIVPAFTFFATAGAVWNCGLRPVFADIDPETFSLDPADVEARLTDRTRAMVAVHLFGQMAPMEPLLELAARHSMTVIEDAAQAFGARQQIQGEWRHAGTAGAAGCFSFYPSKTLGGFGDGGMVVTRDGALADRLRKLRVHGGHKMYHHELVGTNSRLDALQAAVLSVKLPRLAGWLELRRRHASAYHDRLAGLAPELTVPACRAGTEHVYSVYTVRVQRRDELKRFLDAHGIGNAVYYPMPLHLQPCFAALGYRAGDLPASEQAAAEVISLPLYPELTRAQLEEVALRVEQFYSIS
ncbi:MAG: DegT/DnrJ/EryC1/StrS family aminotransferase [Gemmatimonadetes bacterium]|nr:DegT/DnrJ/EryC1/StrS family aminotransferase [Gemmatimonadota bacterium]